MSVKQELLIKSYADVLRDVGVFDPSGEGFLSVVTDGLQKPVTISKRRLCLPVRTLLRESDWTQRIPFHPMSEQINEGPSPVLNALKKFIHFRISETIKVIAKELYTLAGTPSRHSEMSSDEVGLFKYVSGVDQKAIDHLNKVLASVSDAPERRILTMLLKNGGEKGALRTCVVTFPIMDSVDDKDPSTFFGVGGLRKTKPAEKKVLIGLFEYILGDEQARKEYSSPSSDREAPYYHSLLRSFHKLAVRLQGLIDLHKKSCPALEAAAFHLDWTEMLEDFEDFARKNGPSIQPLPGNKGVDDGTTKSSVFEAEGDELGMIDSKEPESLVAHRRYRDDEPPERDRREYDRREERRPQRERDEDRDYVDRGNGPKHASWRDRNKRADRSGSGRDERSGRDRRDSGRSDRGGRW